MTKHRTEPRLFLPTPADDLLMAAPSYLKPGRTFDTERLVAEIGRRPSLLEVHAARVVRGMVRSDAIVGPRPEPLPMGSGKSPYSLRREAEQEAKREKRREERARRKAKRRLYGESRRAA